MSGTRIEYFTIKQYSGTMKFQSGADFEDTLAEMRRDNSVVWLKAYRAGQLVCSITNDKAVPRTKSSPVEKGHIN